MDTVATSRRSLAGLLVVLAIILTACTAGGGAAPSGGDPSAAPPETPVTSPPDDGSPPPVDGGAKVVVPRPGQLDVHDVPADTIAATVDGRKVTVSLDWWSGVEPCTILDTVVIERGDGTYTITLREGRGPEDVACIMIAELHRTFVDLGELEPGTYTIRDGTGGAPDIEVVVS